MEKEKMNEQCCMKCKNFIFKIMLKGFHGHCGLPTNPTIFVRFRDCCEMFEPVEGEQKDG